MDREFESQIKALIVRGEKEHAENAKEREEEIKKEMAKTFGKKQLEEYRHIVDTIISMDCDKTLKVMLLLETLNSTYKLDVKNNEAKTIVKPRIKNKTITGHLVLNNTTIDYIEKNIGEAKSFAKLYFEATDKYRNKTIIDSSVNYRKVNTFNKGNGYCLKDTEEIHMILVGRLVS